MSQIDPWSMNMEKKNPMGKIIFKSLGYLGDAVLWAKSWQMFSFSCYISENFAQKILGV